MKPPADLPLTAVFDEWLPEVFRTSGRVAPADAPRVRATISGEGGGAWDLRADGDTLHVEAIRPDAPDVWLRQSARDLRAGLWGDEDLPDLLPPGWTVLDLLFLDPRDIDLLRQVEGRVAVEISGRRGRRFTFDVAFGKRGVTAGRARSQIALPAPTYSDVIAGRLPPLKALLDGQIKIEGDRALAGQLLLLFAARLAR